MNSLSRSAPFARARAGLRLPAALLVPALVAALLVVMAFVEPRMYSRLNLINVGRNASVGALLALGQMLVMAVGGFDMSVGAVIALAAVCASAVMAAGMLAMPEYEWLVIVGGVGAALLCSAAVGLANALLVTRLRIAPFMATLAVGSTLLGAVFYYTKGSPISGLPQGFTQGLGRGQWLGLPLAVWIAAAALAVIGVLTGCCRFGRHWLAVGGNPSAAAASGIPVERVVCKAYVGCSLLAACAGLLLTARIGSGQSSLGTSAALESIAACVIGGVALRGGSGSAWRVVMAAVFLALLANAMNLARIDSKWQSAVLGLALLGAVSMEVYARRRTSGGIHG